MNLFGTFSGNPNVGNPNGANPNGGAGGVNPADSAQGQNRNVNPNQSVNPISALLSVPLNLISSLFNTLLSPLLRL